MVFGGRDGGRGCGIELALLPRAERCGAHAFGFIAANVANGPYKVCPARGGGACTLVGVQRSHLSQPAGVCERALLGEGDRANEWDSESREGKPFGCGLVLFESRGIKCRRAAVARALLAGFGTCGWRCDFVHNEECMAPVAALASVVVLCVLGGLRSRADFCSDLVAFLAIQRALWFGVASCSRGRLGSAGRFSLEVVPST